MEITIRKSCIFELRLVRQQGTEGRKRDTKYITFSIAGCITKGVDPGDEFRLFDRFHIEKSFACLKAMPNDTILIVKADKPNPSCTYYNMDKLTAELVWLKDNG